ncbi:MAG: class I SAM-dependent methyltransferase [Mucilaginibacter sp.]
MLSRLKYKIGRIIQRINFSPIKYWEERAKQYGERSVLNLSHSAEEMKAVKDLQITTLFPLLKKQLTGTEKTLLDFGCGPGRFDTELAELTGCTVTAADPIEYLLQLAPADPRVSYKKISNGRIPAEDESFDIIWICLVLGGIVTEKTLHHTIKELSRVAKKNSLLFLVENTTEQKDIMTWKYRSKQAYIDLFKQFNLIHLADYDDAGERNSVFAGRLKEF